MGCFFEDKCIIWGAGYCGGIALEAYGDSIVKCFGDSDPRNIGATRWNKKIISFDDMIRISKKDNIRIIIASEDYGNEMEQKLLELGITNYDRFVPDCARAIALHKKKGINPVNNTYFQNAIPIKHDELQKFYNIHGGKRIFIVGNGPSLNSSDLDVLNENNEICFAFNNIYSIFNRTKWRPTYYGLVDYYSFVTNRHKLDVIPGTHFLWDLFKVFNDGDYQEDNKFYFSYIRRGYARDEMPEFSSDITNGLFLGYSSVYDIGLQVAAYMGASEIYLIGVDHNYPNKNGHVGNHFEGYRSDSEIKENNMVFYPIANSNKAYEKEKVDGAFRRAELYSINHGFRIFNVTRGGVLDIFERKDFDGLF